MCDSTCTVINYAVPLGEIRDTRVCTGSINSQNCCNQHVESKADYF